MRLGQASFLRTQIAAASIGCRNLALQIQAEGVKEYDAGWLKEAKSVMRDGSGRFAKKGQAASTDRDSAGSKLTGAGRPRRELNPLLLSSLSQALDASIAEHPDLLGATTRQMPGLGAQANADQLKSAFLSAANRYNKMLEQLGSNKSDPPEISQALSELSVQIRPIAVYLNAAVGSAAAIELLADGGPASILDGYGAGKIAEAAAGWRDKGTRIVGSVKKSKIGKLIRKPKAESLDDLAESEERIGNAKAKQAAKKAEAKKKAVRAGLAVVLTVAAGIALQQGLHAFKLAQTAKAVAETAAEQKIVRKIIEDVGKAANKSLRLQEEAEFLRLQEEAASAAQEARRAARLKKDAEWVAEESRLKEASEATWKASKSLLASELASLKTKILDNAISVANQKGWTNPRPHYRVTPKELETWEESIDAFRKEVEQILDASEVFAKAEESARREFRKAYKSGEMATEEWKTAITSGHQAGFELGLVDLFANSKTPLHHKARLIAYGLDNANGRWLPTTIPKTKAVDDSMFQFVDENYAGGEPMRYEGYSEGDQMRHIRDYSFGSGRYNHPLREKDFSPENAKRINGLKHELSMLPRAKPHEPMVRFIAPGDTDRWVANLKEGGVFSDPAFQSFCPNSFGTYTFDDTGAHPIKILVHPSVSSLGRDITHWNIQPKKEFEVLYPPGVKFKVVRKTKEAFPTGRLNEKTITTSRWVVELEEVDQTP